MPDDIVQDVLDSDSDSIYSHQKSNADSIHSISPGEGIKPLRILTENFNEALCFPTLFPDEKNTHDEDCLKKITLAKYFSN